MVRVLIDAHADVRLTDKVCYTIQVNCFHALHQWQSILCCYSCTQNGWTALHLAAQLGRVDVVRVLIEAHSPLNQCSKVATSALDIEYYITLDILKSARLQIVSLCINVQPLLPPILPSFSICLY